MDITDQIIAGGTYVVGGTLPSWLRPPTAANFNILRGELIELRRLRAAAEAQLRQLTQDLGK